MTVPTPNFADSRLAGGPDGANVGAGAVAQGDP